MTPHTLFAPARRVGQGLLRTQSDDRLVDLARSGSEPAFEAIVARYRKPLLRYCVRLVTEQRAEEAVQETFVRAYGALMRGEEVRTLKPWLYRIAHNSALNTVRAKPLTLVDLDERLESADSTETAAERHEGLRDVVTAMQELPLRQRDAIVQRELEGRSYDEIAVALGVTNGAVRQLLNRARTSLRAGAAAIAAPFVPLAAGLGAGGGGVAAKVCATACVTGVLATGVAPSTDPAGSAPERQKAERPAAKPAEKRAVAAAPVARTGRSASRGRSGDQARDEGRRAARASAGACSPARTRAGRGAGNGAARPRAQRVSPRGPRRWRSWRPRSVPRASYVRRRLLLWGSDRARRWCPSRKRTSHERNPRMTSTPKKLTAVIAGSAVLASAAYGVGTQVGGGNATAANDSGNSSSSADRRAGPGRPDLSGLAQELGVSEAKLRAALRDLRSERPARIKRRGDLAAAIAKELDVSEAKVQAILDDLRPRDGRRPGKARFARALAKELGISTAKVRSALAESKGDRRGPPALDDLAEELGVSEAKLRSALEDIRPRAFRRHRGGDRMQAKLVAALAKGLDKDASEVRAALRKVRAAHEKEHAARRDEFAQKLADKLGISVDKVKAALPAGGPGHHGPGGGPGGPPPGGPGFGGPPPGGP